MAVSAAPKKPGERRLYSLDGIVIGTVIGSPIAGIYMIVHNYIALGSVRLARHSLVAGAFLFGILIALSSIAPLHPWVVLAFIFGPAGLLYLLASRLQGPSIRYHAERGMPVHGLFRSVLVGLIMGTAAWLAWLILGGLLRLIVG